MRDVWFVHAEHGEYSDWCFDPLGVFDSEQEAREFVSRLRAVFTEYDRLDDWSYRPSRRDDSKLAPFHEIERNKTSWPTFGVSAEFVTLVDKHEPTVYISRFEGGIGVIPSWMEVVE